MIIEIIVFLGSILFIFHLYNAVHWFVTKSRKLPDESAQHRGFSILVPCFNEEKIILYMINHLRSLDYDNFEVIFVDDGSTDDTFKLLTEELCLEKNCFARAQGVSDCKSYHSKRFSNFYVLQKKNTGKADSLNKAIAFSGKPLLITLDADSFLAHGTLKIMNNCFADENVIAAGGAIHILQGGERDDRSLLQKVLINLQMLDYMKGFYVYKLSLAQQDATAIISGAFGVFRKKQVLKAGGFRTSLGEDIDLTLKLQQIASQEGKQILYIPQALCYTQCPESIGDLTKQRIRWQKGFVDCVAQFSRRQLPHALLKCLPFHLYIEAFLMGTLSSVFSFSNVLSLLLWPTMETFIIYGVYALLRIILRAAYNAVSIKIAVELQGSKPIMDLSFYIALLVDLFIYGWYLMAIYIYGTVQYFWQGDLHYKWNKVKRNEVIHTGEE